MEEIQKIEIGNTPEIPINNFSDKRTSLKKKLVVIFGLFLVLLLALGIMVAVPALTISNRAKAFYKQAIQLKEVAKTKDLNAIGQQINLTKEELNNLNKSLQLFSFLKPFPVVGAYKSDADHLIKTGEAGLEAADLVVKAIEPYADIIGFSGGNNSPSAVKTAQDRITLVVTTLDKIRPEMEKIDEKVQIAKKEMDQINPKRYPSEIKGIKVREQLTEVITMLDQFSTITHDAKPLMEVAPSLLGIDSPKRYLIIFQNDAELRPTGGFMTAYALIDVDKGKLKPVLSEDIYDLDARFPSKEKAPAALIAYLPIPYKQDPRWRLRDMNLSPDFKVSMDLFVNNFKSASNQKFDGVIGIDSQVLVKLLKVLGQIGVPEWGNFSAEADKRCFGCPNVVYQLEMLADKPVNTQRTSRKAVIGPLMHSVLSNAFQSPKEKIPALFDAGFTSLMEKHVLFYFPEQKNQQAVESFNIAGRIKDYNGDYFHLNDTSFSGAKSNLFIKEEVQQKIEVAGDGSVTKTVTVTYKNPFPASDCNLERGGLCLNAPYRDWFRLYVPLGSQLIDSTGSETEMQTSEELGKTVFSGFFGDKYPLRPEGQAKVTFKYKLPFKVDKSEYRLLIQKQPGIGEYLYNLEINGKSQEFELKTDKEIKVKI